MKKIPLTQNKFAIVDSEDYEYLNQWKWCFDWGYAKRVKLFKNNNKSIVREKISMHRLINKTPNGLDTDHINGNKLDNRRCNLRTCTRSQNLMNKKGDKNTSSKFKGISWNKALEKWRAYVQVDGKQKHLGFFISEKEAVKTYNRAASEHYGDFALLNKI